MFLAIVSSSAMAEWVYANEAIDRKFYINLDSIRQSGNTVKMWILGDFNEVMKMNGVDNHLSYKSQFEYKCEEKQKRVIYQVLYSGNMGKGNIVYTFDEPNKWTPVIPDSAGEYHLEIACGK